MSMPALYVGSTFKVGELSDSPGIEHLVVLGLVCTHVCSLAGRGLKSHAYTHSVQFTHHVFLNLHTLKFYCLPDNYEIIDSSLEDITVSEIMLPQTYDKLVLLCLIANVESVFMFSTIHT